MTEIRIAPVDPVASDVAELVREHLADMHAAAPAESVHALPADALAQPGMSVWGARDAEGTLLGMAALKQLSEREGELKSMRTTEAARGLGLGRALLRHIIAEARGRGHERLLLETGAEDFSIPARQLYASEGFAERGPFGSYEPDPNSIFMQLEL